MDEIGELAPDAQGMLLRFLQEGEGRPVGAAQSINVDVRVIAATHQDLEAGVEGGTFREDFYCQRPPKQSHPGSPIEGQCATVTGLLGVG